ncbi:Class I triheme cytochrome c [Oceaniovalibus guishaninsula JLT2003]|uniref:Class I triheme cytochrome c n=1 Tax=Oceaniovalibus guishaninsula JLT2003 TaxID=1231392 RepID=K2HQA3_9RHOB|nr:c-type cytochrome [Oceaniovalibus guishaninsula]EKE45009.1 Class I triheme cytochrome c [Oceaniovalibus guishaninsula JLT2003]
MRIVLLTLAAAVLTGALAGAAIVGFGLYNVSARAGHLPGIGWLLHTTYRQSVRLRAPGPDAVPDLSAPGLAELGAAHFATACAFCHATPGDVQSATALSMNPRPPYVTDAILDWDPRHLYWIVREGVKMSGMPHWPAARPDEAWALVAYLERVRAGTAPQPRASASRDGPAGLSFCAVCHDASGRSDWPMVPRLDILPADYMTAALAAYRDGRRDSGFMHQAARRLDPGALRDLAAWFAARPAGGAGIGGDPALADAGARLARRGTGDVPACTACHGPDRPAENAAFPPLAGQHAAYLRTQLDLWRDGARGGGVRSNLMAKAAQALTDADIAALAAWYAGLPASGNAGPGRVDTP